MVPLPGLMGFLVMAVVAWLIIGLAIFLAARVVAGSKATYAGALGVTLVGVIIVTIFSIVLTGFLGPFIGSILVFIIWLKLIKSFFRTGWLGAFGISILAIFMLIVIMGILGFLFTLIGLPFVQIPTSIPTNII